MPSCSYRTSTPQQSKKAPKYTSTESSNNTCKQKSPCQWDNAKDALDNAATAINNTQTTPTPTKTNPTTKPSQHQLMYGSVGIQGWVWIHRVPNKASTLWRNAHKYCLWKRGGSFLTTGFNSLDVRGSYQRRLGVVEVLFNLVRCM